METNPICIYKCRTSYSLHFPLMFFHPWSTRKLGVGIPFQTLKLTTHLKFPTMTLKKSQHIAEAFILNSSVWFNWYIVVYIYIYIYTSESLVGKTWIQFLHHSHSQAFSKSIFQLCLSHRVLGTQCDNALYSILNSLKEILFSHLITTSWWFPAWKPSG